VFLLHATELIIKVLEQSLIKNSVLPTGGLNTANRVYFSYQRWDREWLNQLAPLHPKMKEILVFKVGSDLDAEPLIGPLSIGETREVLGVSKTVIPRYLNFNRFFFSPTLGFKVRVQEVGIYNLDIGDVPFFHRAKINSQQIEYDLSSLNTGARSDKIFALRTDGTLLNKEGFNSVGEAVKSLDPEKYKKLSASGNVRFEYLSRYINLKHQVNTASGSFYFIANPITLELKNKLRKAVPIVTVNILTGEIQHVESIRMLCKTFDVKIFRYNLYLDTSRIWLNKYRLFRRSTFESLYPDSLSVANYTVNVNTL